MAETAQNIFIDWIKQQPPQYFSLFVKHKEQILKQAFFNLNFPSGYDFTDLLDERDTSKLYNELKDIIDLISVGFPNLINYGVESKNLPSNENKKAHDAYNIASHFICGNPNSQIKSIKSWAGSPTQTRDPALLNELRKIAKNVFTNALNYLQTNGQHNDEKLPHPNRSIFSSEKHCTILLSNLLAAYPLLENGEELENIKIPQKINEEWKEIEYKINKLDVSPKSGLLGCMLEDEDRMYVYGLTPVDTTSSARPHLLLMRTPPASSQGTELAEIYNYSLNPLKSIGEEHDWTEVEEWIKVNSNIIVHGHSKGATVGMILAAKHPQKITEVHSLNPSGLARDTLRKYFQNDSAIHIYIQEGDWLIPTQGKGFLPNSHIYKILSPTVEPLIIEAPVRAYENHLHYFAGRQSLLMLKVKCEQENRLNQRLLLDWVKILLNPLLFSIRYIGFVYTLGVCKLKRYEIEIDFFLFLGSGIIIFLLLLTGGLPPVLLLSTTPMALSFLAKVAISVGYGIVSVLLPNLFLTLSDFFSPLVSAVLHAILSLIATVIGVIIFLFESFLKLCLTNPTKLRSQECNQLSHINDEKKENKPATVQKANIPTDSINREEALRDAFFLHYNAYSSIGCARSYWKTINYEKRSIEEIIKHARGENRYRFFSGDRSWQTFQAAFNINLRQDSYKNRPAADIINEIILTTPAFVRSATDTPQAR